jgi:hypothetical protein
MWLARHDLHVDVNLRELWMDVHSMTQKHKPNVGPYMGIRPTHYFALAKDKTKDKVKKRFMDKMRYLHPPSPPGEITPPV